MSEQDDGFSRRRRRLYDSTAGLYTAVFPLIWRVGFPGLHGWLRTELHGANRILDAGAGPGYWSRYIARVRTRPLLVALDFSAAYIAQARRFLPAELDVKLVQADLTRMPFPDRCFDAILCSGVLDTMPEPSLALREFRRILRDNGRLLLILRGNGAILSAGVEKVFRLSITAFGFLTHRSDRIGPEARLWSRTPVGPQLNTLAETAGLRVAELASGRLVTHAVLVPEG